MSTLFQRWKRNITKLRQIENQERERERLTRDTYNAMIVDEIRASATEFIFEMNRMDTLKWLQRQGHEAKSEMNRAERERLEHVGHVKKKEEEDAAMNDFLKELEETDKKRRSSGITSMSRTNSLRRART